MLYRCFVLLLTLQRQWRYYNELFEHNANNVLEQSIQM